MIPPVRICPIMNRPALCQNVIVEKPHSAGMMLFHSAITANPANAGNITRNSISMKSVLIAFSSCFDF